MCPDDCPPAGPMPTVSPAPPDLIAGSLETGGGGGGHCLYDADGTHIGFATWVIEDDLSESEIGAVEGSAWRITDLDGNVTYEAALPAGATLGICDKPDPVIGEPECMLVDGKPMFVRPMHIANADGSITTTWHDPIKGVLVENVDQIPTGLTATI